MIKQVFKTMVAFLAVATMTIGPAGAQNSSTSSLVFTEAYGTGGATADDEVEWTVTSDGTESNYDGTKGIHYGTSKLQVQYIQLSTSDIIGTITQVKVNASTASGVNDATVSVTVGGNAFGGNAQGLSINATDYTFTGSATGEIVVRVAKSSAAIRALYVKSVVVTYTPASSGGGSGSETPTPGQNSSTYNVTFGGFNNPDMNTTVNVASLPQTFTGVGVYDFYPFEVISEDCYEFTSASVTSGGEGKVSVNIPNWNSMTITVTGTFEGTATIHVVGEDNYENAISRDITVAFTLPPTPHTVRMAAGTEEAANWSIASGNAQVPGTQVLENVMSGSEVTATYSGTQKVKSVKAVKYVVPPTPLDNTTTAWTAGTYAVPAGGLTYSDAITVSGDVTLVLTDGETLTLNKGISLASGATLTIQGNGTMNVNGTNENTASTVAGSGTITLTSGTLTATGGNGGSVGEEGAGAEGGAAINGTVIVDGGTLTATGGKGGNVGNDAVYAHGGAGGAAIIGSVTVNSGTLTATGGNGGSVGDFGYNCGGGAGSAAISGDLTINSGTETLTNGANGQLGADPDNCSAGTGSQAVAGTVTDNR